MCVMNNCFRKSKIGLMFWIRIKTPSVGHRRRGVFFFFLFDINAWSIREAALAIALISTPLPRAAGFNLKPL